MSRFGIVTAALALLPASAFAQGPAEDRTPIVVTATRTGTVLRADQIGGSVSIIDAQAVASRQARDVSDLLRDVPGVAVSRIAGQTQVRLRGTEGNHVLVLVDGIEVSDPFQGEFDFDTLIADEGSQLEILRGQQSALYGSDAIGGVIQYLTASGRDTPGVSARAEGGSFNTVNAAVRLGGVAGAVDYALTGTLNTTDGTPNARNGQRNLHRDSGALAFKSTWQLADNFALSAVARYAETAGDSNDSESRTLSPNFGLIVDTPGVGYKTRSAYGLVRGRLDLLGGRWTHTLTAQVADAKRDRFKFGVATSGSRSDRIKGSYDTSLSVGSGTVRHRFTVAADAERERYRNADPSGFAFTGRESTGNFGFVGQYQLLIGDAAVLGGSVRHDINDRFADATTYRVEASYALSSGTRLRAAAGSGVKNPGFYELFGFVDGRYIGNPNLQPERSEGWEAGVEQSFLDRAVLVGATYFDNRLENEIFTTFPAPTFVATPGNRTTRSTQSGVEVFLQARLGSAWRVDAAFTRLKARENGVEEVRRPSTIASVAIGWRAPSDRGGVTAVVRYNGSQTDLAFTNANFVPVRVRLDDYVLVNLNADMKLTDRLTAFARVENLIDERYEDVFSFRTAPRAAYIGLRVKL